jgi:hypothetical protein
VSEIRIPQEQLDIVVKNTIAVRTVAPERRDEWRALLQQQREATDELPPEQAFFDALLALVDDAPVTLADENPYRPIVLEALAAIERYAPDNPTLDAAEVERLIGYAASVMTYRQAERENARELFAQNREIAAGGAMTYEEAFFAALLELLDGGTPALPPEHPYADALAQIQARIAAYDGTPPPHLSESQVDELVMTTVAAVKAAPEQVGDWRDILSRNANVATENGMSTDAAFFNALIATLDGERPALPPDNPYAPAIERVVMEIGR